MSKAVREDLPRDSSHYEHFSDLLHPNPKTDRVAKKTFFEKCITLGPQSLISSEALRVLAVTGLFIAGGLLLANPGGMLLTAIAVAYIGLGLLEILHLSLELLFNRDSLLTHKMSFELSSIGRLLSNNNYGEIIIPYAPPDTGGLFFGAIPNQWTSEGEHLVNRHEISRVIAVTERWEGETMGLSAPYSPQDWATMKVTHSFLPVEDHTLLSIAAMDKAADEIHEALQSGENVYVHCRAGVGRSAQAVAAYLLKYGRHSNSTPLSIEEVCKIILQARPKATILNKLSTLQQYVKDLDEKYPELKGRPDNSPLMLEALDFRGSESERLVALKALKKEFKRTSYARSESQEYHQWAATHRSYQPPNGK